MNQSCCFLGKPKEPLKIFTDAFNSSTIRLNLSETTQIFVFCNSDAFFQRTEFKRVILYNCLSNRLAIVRPYFRTLITFQAIKKPINVFVDLCYFPMNRNKLLRFCAVVSLKLLCDVSLILAEGFFQ